VGYPFADIAVAVMRAATDDTGWMQLLVFVVMGVIYAVASIVRAKGKKTQLEEEGKEQLARKPAEPAGRAAQRQRTQQATRLARPAPARKYQVAAQAQQHPRPVARPQRVAPKLAVQKRPAAEMPRLELLEEAIGPEAEAKLQEMPEFTGTTAGKAVGKPEAASPAALSGVHLADILSDYAHPDDLMKAILHYEIIGKPLALRGPTEDIVGR
jgi:hypothetical protein